MKPFSALGGFAAALFASACATAPSPPSRALDTPFVLERDLLGSIIARGEFRSITGVRRGLTATLTGRMEGDVFTLEEDFLFDDGMRDRKTWRLTRVAPGEYVGTREDVIGQARGFQDGNVFRLEYRVRLPQQDGDGIVVRFRDVLYLEPGGSVGNDAIVGWYGFRVGSVNIRMERVAAEAPTETLETSSR